MMTRAVVIRDSSETTPCCGAYASVFEDGSYYCKRCFGAVICTREVPIQMEVSPDEGHPKEV